MTITKQPSCDDPFDALLPVELARQQLLEAVESVVETEQVELSQATGRILAGNTVSPINVPSYTNSAMDGYAISATSIPALGEAQLNIIGTAWAGRIFDGSVSKGEAVRVFTGALMPDGADTVVIQEHVLTEGDCLTIDSKVVPYRNVRQAGEDVEQNSTVLTNGTQLRAAEIGVLASLGIATVTVYRKLRVAYFTTGDELRSLDTHAGQTLPPGMLFDSNRYTLQSMLQNLNVTVLDLGIVKDDAEETRKVMQRAADSADLVVTSGGISAGDADFVTQVFHELGTVNFWKLAMRPGRPLAFGKIGNAFFFGLPGNPVAVMVTFLQFVQPAIRQLSGQASTLPYTVLAECQSTLRKSLGRVEFQRGILSNDADGKLIVNSTGKQGAGRISSMSAANCLIVIDAEVAGVKPGDSVQVQPFSGLFG